MNDKIKENDSVLRQACIELEKTRWENFEVPEKFNYKVTKRDKRKLNRFGREKIGLKNALHPEVDNLFERTRSNFIRWWNVRKEKK